MIMKFFFIFPQKDIGSFKDSGIIRKRHFTRTTICNHSSKDIHMRHNRRAASAPAPANANAPIVLPALDALVVPVAAVTVVRLQSKASLQIVMTAAETSATQVSINTSRGRLSLRCWS
jgi:hypothetical protein